RVGVSRQSVEDVAKARRAEPRTAVAWKTEPNPNPTVHGECKGEWVVADGFDHAAYLKPGKIGRDDWGYPVAAHEKIAADLAYDLACPVPAVQVWERTAPPEGYCHYACVSLREFPKRFGWGYVAAAHASASDAMKVMSRAVLAAASCSVVLDTWLGQADRGDHPENVQLGYDPNGGLPKLVFLDFARTLNCDGRWAGEGWKSVNLCQEPALVTQYLDKDLVRRTLDAAESVSDEKLRDVCGRLVGPHFKTEYSDRIVTALIWRRSMLRSALG